MIVQGQGFPYKYLYWGTVAKLLFNFKTFLSKLIYSL